MEREIAVISALLGEMGMTPELKDCNISGMEALPSSSFKAGLDNAFAINQKLQAKCLDEAIGNILRADATGEQIDNYNTAIAFQLKAGLPRQGLTQEQADCVARRYQSQSDAESIEHANAQSVSETRRFLLQLLRTC